MMQINADIGEIPQHIADGTQEALLPFLTEVNIACGGHAGDDETMRVSVEQARRHGLRIGAHPGYPDRENFGRVAMAMGLAEVEETVYRQVSALAAIAGELTHVKPHGALYNLSAADEELARAIARGVARFSKAVTLVGLAGSKMLDVFRSEGFAIAREGFADRAYNADGTLRARTLPGALIEDPAEAAAQALRMAASGTIDTICVHGDTPGAAAIASAVAKALIL